jgi:hypothetical protein
MSDSAARQPYLDHRTAYLEKTAIDSLAKMSRHSVTIRNARYRFDDGDGIREYETDGLVVIDSILFVVEAKGGRLKAAGRLGLKARKEIEGLTSDAQGQAARLVRYLQSDSPAVFETNNGPAVISASIREVILVAPTLESLHAFVTRWTNLAAAGLVPQDPWVWSVSSRDLRVTTEIVETAAQLVHYLKRRREADALEVGAAEELDFFGYYLAAGLFFDEIRTGKIKGAWIGDSMTKIRAHYEDGQSAPLTPMSSAVRGLAQVLAEVGPPGWMLAAGLLYDGDQMTRDDIGHRVEASRKRVRTGESTTAASEWLMDGVSLIYASFSGEMNRDWALTVVTTSKQARNSSMAIGIFQSVDDARRVEVVTL